jgi:hypothetical protein
MHVCRTKHIDGPHIATPGLHDFIELHSSYLEQGVVTLSGMRYILYETSIDSFMSRCLQWVVPLVQIETDSFVRTLLVLYK